MIFLSFLWQKLSAYRMKLNLNYNLNCKKNLEDIFPSLLFAPALFKSGRKILNATFSNLAKASRLSLQKISNRKLLRIFQNLFLFIFSFHFVSFWKISRILFQRLQTIVNMRYVEPGKSLYRLKVTISLVQLLTYCRIGCWCIGIYFLQLVNNQAHHWLTIAHAIPSPSLLEISLCGT